MRLIPDHYLQIRDLILYNEKVKNPFKIVALGDIHLSRLVDERKLEPIKYKYISFNNKRKVDTV